MTSSFTLTFSCADQPGIVAAVSTCLFRLGCNITDAQQFDDALSNSFFSRIQFDSLRSSVQGDDVRAAVATVLESLDAAWSVHLVAQRRRVLIMVSRLDHCLGDLLYRWRVGELPMDLVGVVSNHPREVFPHIDFTALPYHHLPVTPATRRGQENKLLALVEEYHVDLVILARYMQILSDETSAQLTGRCINIHHSFLPAFMGAKPYHQAHARGVKLIGATAHYVTGDLDEGPIIAQDVERVTHRDAPDTLVRKGRDIERRVLATAVKHHLEDRVLLNGNTAVVFAE